MHTYVHIFYHITVTYIPGITTLLTYNDKIYVEQLDMVVVEIRSGKGAKEEYITPSVQECGEDHSPDDSAAVIEGTRKNATTQP